ncbi:DUF2178 domain-containing protein [Methanobacterium sp. ACI-7]|uniref:DUF2178 domain-containing protein n=1 Tax=unclassified Methanobacterium TaxID=2627676 RepID=UPI0039C41C65
MEKRTYQVIRASIMIFIAITVSIAIYVNNFLLAFTGIVLAFLLSYFVRKNVYEISEDERTYLVAGKASRTAMFSFLTIITVLGIGILTLKDIIPQFTQVGYTLTNSGCLLLLLYAGFYLYYNKKHG